MTDYLTGIDLLVNPKKKISSDTISILSSSSSHKHRHSSKSTTKPPTPDHELDHHHAMPKQRPKLRSTASSSVSNSDFAESSSESGSSTYSGTSSELSDMSQQESPKKRHMSPDDILNAKREILYQFDRMERKGHKVPKKFTLASSLEEMTAEYERIKTDKEIELSIKFQRKVLTTMCTGAEFLNSRFDPFGVRLDGWSDNIQENITDYDDIFEELHSKYSGRAKMPPELRLMFMVGGSAFMYHITNTMFKTSLPGLDQVMKQNPDLMRQFASATMNTMAANQGAPPGGGMPGILSSLFNFGGPSSGGGGGDEESPRADRPTTMRGPQNVDDILSELHSQQQQGAAMHNNDDRIEVISTLSESEISELPDDASIAGLLPRRQKKPTAAAAAGGAASPQRRTLNV